MRISVNDIVYCVLFISLFLGCSKNIDDSDFTNANGVIGAKLYDKFWAMETGFNQFDTARYSADSARYNPVADFFRCTQCHGYDLLGRTGGYANRAPTATRPNVANINLSEASTKSNSALFQAIKNGDNPAIRRSLTEDLSTYNPISNNVVGDRMPNYAEILSDAQIWDLVKFLKTEGIDANGLYDCTVSGAYPTATVTYSNIGKDGNAADGMNIYSRHCKSCHGETGINVWIITDERVFFVGGHVRFTPEQDAHTIRFGVLGSSMGDEKFSHEQLKNLFKALADSTQFP